jgi:CheY-like chemotaxis protein
LINLVINARDAMPQGGSLTIETANVTMDEAEAGQNEDMTPGDYVRIAVSDTGSGMPPEVLEKVFEPFFTTKEVGKGSGLGLSMVYGFIKQSRGHVHIYSEIGQGTTVELCLPHSLVTVTQEEPADETPVLAKGSERILVVEDDEDLRDVLTSILRDQGYEVVEAENGKQAINHLKDDEKFDLLFTDVILPGGINGVEIAEEARRMQPDVKVLLTSGYAENETVQSGKLDPGVTLVNKPYREKELLETVRKMLDCKNA